MFTRKVPPANKARHVTPTRINSACRRRATHAPLSQQHDSGAVQEQMNNEMAVQGLSQSHMLCWRTLAVTLELFPALYRQCMFQLSLVPPSVLISEQLLLELWTISSSDMPLVISIFTSVSILVPLLTAEGRRWHVSNMAQDYMVYWARMSGKGSRVGRLQRWLLDHPVRSRRCPLFCSSECAPLAPRHAVEPRGAPCLGRIYLPCQGTRSSSR